MLYIIPFLLAYRLQDGLIRRWVLHGTLILVLPIISAFEAVAGSLALASVLRTRWNKSRGKSQGGRPGPRKDSLEEDEEAEAVEAGGQEYKDEQSDEVTPLVGFL